eukprot:8704056-Karenia_brevis.AAC.1
MQAACVDVRVALLESVYVVVTLDFSRRQAAEAQEGADWPSNEETRAQRLTQASHSSSRAAVPASPPAGSWEFLDDVDVKHEFLRRVPMLKSCPGFLRVRLRQAFDTALSERHRASRAGDESCTTRAWKLFVRAQKFAQGQWEELLEDARANSVPQSKARQAAESAEQEMRRKGLRALASVRCGELSRARQQLTGAALAPRDEATRAELQSKRPQQM